jgi:four helix bundle protein
MAIKQDIGEKLLDFAAGVYRLTDRLGRTAGGRHIAGQLMRAAASAGANYHEACCAESRADFIHKLQVALKELREAEYWLLLVERTKLASGDVLKPMMEQAGSLVRIRAKSVVAAKSRAT